MNTQVILHPTEATPVPVTLIATGRARGVRKSRDITCKDLLALCRAAGLRATTAHTKAELRAMLRSGEYVRPAAYDRQNAKRREARAAKRATA